MELSHIDSSASRADEQQRAPVVNPYAIVPPVGRLLDLICTDRNVGGCFRPGNRQLADRLGYASAGQIPYLLSQLACDGWINYDPRSGVIMLLRHPYMDTDPWIRSTDQCDEDATSDTEEAEFERINMTDRVMARSDAENAADPDSRSNPQCMEDHVLAAADHDSESAAASYKYHVPQKTISPTDHPASLLLSELGADPTIIADALSARPDLSPEQIRGSWAHFEPRIKAGLCTAGAFFAAIRRGQLHAAPPDPNRPLDPAAYAADPAYQLGSATDPPEVESIGDIARRLLPPDASTADWVFVQTRLARGDTEAGALQALSERRRR